MPRADACPRQCPTLPATLARMRRRREEWQQDIARNKEIARFGEAVITRDLRGRFEIRGGTDAERKQAHDWLLSWSVPLRQQQS